MSFTTSSPTAIVPGEGPLDCKICIVGEAPGSVEQAQLRPFIGPAGNELNFLLHSVGIVRTSCYITNVIKEQPRNNEIKLFIDTSKNFATPQAREYIDHLKRELEGCSANVIVTLGNTALWALTGRSGILKWRGSVLESTLLPGRKIIPTIHPRAVIGPTGVFLWKHLINFDLVRAMKESEFPEIRNPSMDLLVRPSFEEVVDYLNRCKENDIVDVDIEVLREEVSCISFAQSPSSSISIPFTYEHGDYWQPDQEAYIFRLIAEILEDPGVIKRGQNFLFDTFFLWKKHGIRTVNILDTMIAQGVAYPDFNKGLDFITSIFTNIPYYKDEGKQWNRITGSWEQHWLYNCKDTIATSHAFPAQYSTILSQGNIDTYRRQNELVEPLLFMQARGIKMDTIGLKMASESINKSIEHLEHELWSICGFEINPRSPAQLVDYFYNQKGIKPYVDRKTKRPTTDEKALTRLAIKGYREAELLLKLREYNKLKGTYLDVKLDEDGRMRCSYNPVGAATGRLSSSKTIFGTGGNLQNQPPEMKQFMLFDEGYVGYEIDLSQAENRIVAYCGPVPEMIKAFEDKLDVHRLTASLIFGIPYDEVSDERGSSPLAGGAYSQRFWGKKCKLRSCQVLTREGWVGIEDAYIKGSEILQWDKGIVAFVKPSDWYVDTFTGDIHIIENQRIFQECTPDHKMPLQYEDGRFLHKPIQDYPKSGKYKALLSGTLEGGITLPDPFIRLLVAFQADGTWNSNGITIRVTKERKINRLLAILELCSINYTQTDNGIYLSAKEEMVKTIRLLLGKEKDFGKWLLDLSVESRLVFLDELPHWDGYIRDNLYFTTNQNNAIWVQTVAHLCDKAALINEQDNSQTDAYGNKIVYRVTIRDTTKPSTHAIDRRIRQVVDEPILCPTVPSGFFLCRENGIISVTGNTNHGLNYDEGPVTFSLNCEIELKEGKYLVEAYHRAYPGVRQNYHTMIRTMLNKSRTVLNPLGRRRLFLDRMDDSLFKAAYGHFPQSTVGDIINERGVNYIYYNQQLFKDVELLLQIHDSVVFQIPLSVPLPVHAELVWSIKKQLETPVIWRTQQFIIPADIKVSFGSMAKGPSGFQELKGISSLEALSTKLCSIAEQRGG